MVEVVGDQIELVIEYKLYNESKKIRALKHILVDIIRQLVILCFISRKYNGNLDDGTRQTGKDPHSKAAGCDAGVF